MKTRKRSSSSPQNPHHHPRVGSKIVIYICFVSCLLAYLGLHSRFKLHRSTSFASQATPSFAHDHFEGAPKIAFLFLARRSLPLDFLWGSFFKNGDAANFSIYVHAEPGFVFNDTTTRSALFYGRQLNNSIQVAWGGSSMIEAEKLLFEAALHDPANQRFVLLSDSCVPLYNFSYIYSYLISSPKSYVDSFIEMRGIRYDPKMAPIIPKNKWRKGSQWISLVRRHAGIVVEDDTVFPVFKKFCKRWPPKASGRRRIMRQRSLDHKAATKKEMVHAAPGKEMLEASPKKRNCIPDEHYVQTLLTMNGLENELERRTLTYTSWDDFVIGDERVKSWHPGTFYYPDASPESINEIKAMDHIDHNSEANGTMWCHASHKRAPCFLFARKFTQWAAMRLMTEGFVGPYDPAAATSINSLVP